MRSDNLNFSIDKCDAFQQDSLYRNSRQIHMWQRLNFNLRNGFVKVSQIIMNYKLKQFHSLYDDCYFANWTFVHLNNLSSVEFRINISRTLRSLLRRLICSFEYISILIA